MKHCRSCLIYYLKVLPILLEETFLDRLFKGNNVTIILSRFSVLDYKKSVPRAFKINGRKAKYYNFTIGKC